MFVFPAFDSNYKTRKRVFRCCERCRVKRVKCSFVEGSDGCANCIKSKSGCSLVKAKADEIAKSKTPEPSIVEQQQEAQVGQQLTQSQLQFPYAPSDIVDVRMITPYFLKKQFNFNVSGMSEERAYQYVFHDHPKVVINDKISDKTYWHESGIHVGYKDKLSGNEKNQPRDDSNVRSLHSSTSVSIKLSNSHHIRDKRTYDYLASINAFSLTSGTYALTPVEVRQLIDIYFTKINSVFPIMNPSSFWEEYYADLLPSICLYALILAISKDSSASTILSAMFVRNGLLSMPGSSYDAVYIDYIGDLENKIRQLLLVLPQLGDYDKLTRLATTLLLSLHFGYDRFGNEQASHDLTDAINLAFSMGIHMKRQLSELEAEKISHLNNLWWICFIFDRFNALINCRSIFIRQKDFNIDLPKNINLMKLTQVAKSLENMLEDIYRPFKRETVKPRNEVYNMDEFKENEFRLCEEEKVEPNNEGVETYMASTVHLLTRLVNNVIILASQKSKYDNKHIPNSIPDSIAFQASQNILWYINHQEPSLMMNIPILPWCLSLAMAVSLKRKAKSILRRSDGNGLEKETFEYPASTPASYVYQLHDFFAALEKYSSKWWIVDEICKLSRDFEEKLIRKTRGGGGKSKHKIGVENLEVQNKKIRMDEGETNFDAASLQDGALSGQTTSEQFVEQTQNQPTIDNSSISLSRIPTMDFNTLSYDDYFGSLQMDLFDNGVFMGLPDVLSTPHSSASQESPSL
ncbi:hypothetical protein CLIB1423_08S02366 [[Candida] railenensis]|uniref:Xylanolytic transcriptional activator regulatory domain-containing protein n=1 Tax=[Candida] railenensis TaxID=45579 RepID=A0A9P0QP64_9ASCO|nr:hypothetical protein CLIB1423_08S02366 [[Candida] railenensis]